MKITIQWNGHSCFTVAAEQYEIVLDPYAPDSVPGLPELELTADAVLKSHDHRDHGFFPAVTIRENHAVNPFTIDTIDTFHDPEQGKLRGKNRIHILTAGGMKIVHLGDLGCSLTEEEIEKLKGSDVLMIPVGGYFTIDAAEALSLVSRLKPRIVLPMHYRGEGFGYPVIGTLEEFTDGCDEVWEYDSDTLSIDETTPEQTAVLRFC